MLVLTGNYGGNENVEWTIVVPDGQVVRLDFYTFNTHSGNDYVRVYDGCTGWDPLIKSYYGDNHPGAISSTGNVLHITFKSDGSTTKQGFSAFASGVDMAVCPGQRDTQKFLTIGQDGKVNITSSNFQEIMTTMKIWSGQLWHRQDIL